jgi:hypothetical protein
VSELCNATFDFNLLLVHEHVPTPLVSLTYTTRKIVIGCVLSETVYFEMLSDHISTAVHNLNR